MKQLVLSPMHSIVGADVGAFVENDRECSATSRHGVDREDGFEGENGTWVGSEVGLTFVVTARVKSDLALGNRENDYPNTGEYLDGKLDLEKTDSVGGGEEVGTSLVKRSSANLGGARCSAAP